MFLSIEEKEFCMTQLSYKNMPNDMAMFFITQDIEYDDIFFVDYWIKEDFYNNVFLYLFAYIKDKIDRNLFSEVLRDVFLKLNIRRYYHATIDYDGTISRDGYGCGLIDATFKYLLENAKYNDINALVDTIVINERISPNILFPTMMANPGLCHYEVMENLIHSDYLPMSCIVELFLERMKVTDFNSVKELIQTLFINKEMFLEMLYAIMQYYEISYSIKDDKSTVTIECNSEGERKENLEQIRRFMCTFIWVDAEMDFFDWIDTSRIIHLESHDLYRSNIYSLYKRWYDSWDRADNAVPNMLFYGAEDYIMTEFDMDTEAYGAINKDLLLKRYIFDMDTFNGYDAFIRLFNLNRFKLCLFNSSEDIRTRIFKQINEYPLYIRMAVSMELYLFIKCI